MLIIVEGPDLAGKSTLVDALKTALTSPHQPAADVEVLHAGPPEDHPLREYEVPLMAYRPGMDWHIICDRWHVGERVYPLLHDRATQLDDAVLHHIELFLRSRGALLVHLTEDDDVLLERRAGRDELTHELNLQARDLFRKFVPESPLHHVTFRMRFDPEGLTSIVSLVTEMARTLETQCTRLNSLVTYVGSHRPELLLFGDVRANGPQAKHLTLAGDVPAFVPFRATSGHYLLSALGDDVTRFGIGLANACDVDDPYDVWKTLGYPRVVALGRNASRRLVRGGIRHREVEHPQYRRRFHHHDGAAYANEIVNGGRESEWSIS